jgi:parallel beta-helix repeat protein
LTGNEVGILVEDQLEPLAVSGNRVGGSTLDGISLTRADGAVVVNNRVADSGRDGIRLLDTDAALVALNRVADSGRWGVALDGDSDDTLVVRNVVRGSGEANLFVGPVADGTVRFGNRL